MTAKIQIIQLLSYFCMLPTDFGFYMTLDYVKNPNQSKTKDIDGCHLEGSYAACALSLCFLYVIFLINDLEDLTFKIISITI